MGRIVSLKKDVEVLNPSASDSGLIVSGTFFRSNQVKMKSLGQVLIQYDWCPYEKGNFGYRDRHREERWCRDTQGEDNHGSVVNCPQARECQRWLANRKSQMKQGRILPQSHVREYGSANALISNFQSPKLQDNQILLF